MSLADALGELNFATTCMWQATGDTNNGISENWRVLFATLCTWTLRSSILVQFFVSKQTCVNYDWLKYELKIPPHFPRLASSYLYLFEIWGYKQRVPAHLLDVRCFSSLPLSRESPGMDT